MIALDTNVVSELMRPRPDPVVVAWVDAQDAQQLYLPAVCIAEVLFGIARLPVGRRRDQLAQTFSDMLADDFTDRTLAFDEHAAVRFAQVAAAAETHGRPMSVADAQIAATCLLHDAQLATRNTKDFARCGLVLVDPWQRDA